MNGNKSFENNDILGNAGVRYRIIYPTPEEAHAAEEFRRKYNGGTNNGDAAEHNGKAARIEHLTTTLNHHGIDTSSELAKSLIEKAVRDGVRWGPCPPLIKGLTDLATRCPDIAREAHNWDPSDVTKGAKVKREWKCPNGHIYTMRVAHRTCVSKRTGKTHGCKKCSRGSMVIWTKEHIEKTFPLVAAEIVDWENKPNRARAPMFGFKCPEGHHYTRAFFVYRSKDGPGRKIKKHGKDGCVYCKSKKLLKGFNDLKTKKPELAALCRGVDPSEVLFKSYSVEIDWDWPCGHTDPRSPGFRLKNGYGPKSKCTGCRPNPSGFNKSMPGFFYLLRRPGQIQFGISNRIEKRLANHRKNGWELIEAVGSIFGNQILDLERLVKEFLNFKGIPRGKKAFREKFDGWTESFQTVDLDCSSIVDLLTKLGITPPDFVLANGKPIKRKTKKSS